MKLGAEWGDFDPSLLNLETERREIGPEVFMLSTTGETEPFTEDTGVPVEDILLCIPCRAALQILSKEAIAAGYEEDGFLYYSAPYHFMIPLYELLEGRVITDYDIIRRFDPQELHDDGKYFCPYYFGELESAVRGRNIEVTGQTRVSNGLDAFQYIDGGVELAIHETAAHYELSDAAEAFAVRYGHHLHYQNETCAIPLYELTDTYPSLRELISDEAEMIKILKKNYSSYLLACGLDN